MRVPSYYNDFACKAGSCRDSCCVGWELDIDEASYQRYRAEKGAFGDRLRAHMEDIDEDGEIFHTFRREGPRCPFLNDRNLCDICLVLGGDALCVVCTEYPRYTITFNGRIERTLTLSCEEAARLQFQMAEPLRLVEAASECCDDAADESAGECCGDAAYEDIGRAEPSEEHEEDLLSEVVLYDIRQRAIALLQDRSRPIEVRIASYLAFAERVQDRINEALDDGASASHIPEGSLPAIEHAGDAWMRGQKAGSFEERMEILGCLEVLNDEWRNVFDSLKAAGPSDRNGFNAADLAYEHLAVYFTLRYFPQAAGDGDVLGKARFCRFCLNVIHDMEALGIPFLDCVRIFCKEVEHSDDNIGAIMEELIFAEYN